MAISNNIATLGMDEYSVLDADFGSNHFNIGYARAASVQAVVDNTDAVGELVVQVSNNRTNWVDVAFVDESGVVQDGYDVTTGDDLNHMFDVSDVSAGWLRLKYNRTSGTGGLNMYVHIKKQ